MLLVIVIAALLSVGSPSPGQAAVASDPVTPDRPVRLSALLAARDYMTLTRTVLSATAAPDVVADLDWLRSRMVHGDTTLVTMLYARRLWEVSLVLPQDRADGLRQTAVMAMLYGYGQSLIDGERCGDPTAPSHVRDGLHAWLPGVGAYIDRLPTATRVTLVDLAVRTDALTAAQRDATGDVAFLCRNGVEETQYDLKHGTRQSVPTQPGQIGTTVVLKGDGKYKPSLRPDVVWKPLAASDRAALHDTLTKLVSAPIATPPFAPKAPATDTPPPIIVGPDPRR